jgi:hypothetical protein
VSPRRSLPKFHYDAASLQAPLRARSLVPEHDAICDYPIHSRLIPSCGERNKLLGICRDQDTLHTQEFCRYPTTYAVPHPGAHDYSVCTALGGHRHESEMLAPTSKLIPQAAG